jgi:hypothetical protein
VVESLEPVEQDHGRIRTAEFARFVNDSRLLVPWRAHPLGKIERREIVVVIVWSEGNRGEEGLGHYDSSWTR